uniref:Uncharacterized protein n=1 Tax=Craspedostauros australis TaxID=1486917 RepID=A0A7R9WN40_9STRA|mmetsp:Transcript_10954/g.30277  ORF Transcript_10954/g.30277 Transcript_10954/m.30277 type:complete len:143 (+) Transcript_10954:1-429(+)
MRSRPSLRIPLPITPVDATPPSSRPLGKILPRKSPHPFMLPPTTPSSATGTGTPLKEHQRTHKSPFSKVLSHMRTPPLHHAILMSPPTTAVTDTHTTATPNSSKGSRFRFADVLSPIKKKRISASHIKGLLAGNKRNVPIAA